MIENSLYNLDDRGRPIPAKSFSKWTYRVGSPSNVVARTTVGQELVSTIFLGSDYNYGHGRPHLWETWGPADQITRCGGSRKNALRMHRKAVNLALHNGVKVVNRTPNTNNLTKDTHVH